MLHLRAPAPRLLAAVLLFSGCGGGSSGSPTSPSSAQSLPVFAETQRYVYRAAAGDTIDTAWQERYHAWATAALGLSPRRITYHKYQSRTSCSRWSVSATPTPTPTATPSPFTPSGRSTITKSSTCSPRPGATRWSGTPLHTLARQFRSEGRLAQLSGIIETAGWRTYDSNVAYPQAGSFVRWLIDTYGLDRIRLLYGRSAGINEAASGVRAAFATVYGVSLDEAEQAWLMMLDDRRAANGLPSLRDRRPLEIAAVEQ